MLLVLLVGAAGCNSDSTVAPVDRRSLTPLQRPPLERALERMVQAWGSPGAVALLRTPRGTWHGATGFSNLRTKRKMQPGDRFWVGSVTKTFIATVVLQLVGEGRLRLDDKVARWFPDLVPHAREISIRQLLNHTSGVIDYFGDPAFLARVSKNPRLVIPPRRRIAIAASHPLLFRPGTDWRYSNTGYLILGLIVEKVTGNPVGEELENRLVGPLRLEHTTFDSGRRTGAGQVRGYDLSGPTPRDATLDNLGGPWTDGAIVSNTDDIARFFGALLGGQLLPNELLGAMKTTVVPIRGGGGYGLGLGKHKVFCGGAWGHTGGTPGYLTQVLASPSGARIAIVAANGGPTALDATSEHLYCWKHP